LWWTDMYASGGAVDEPWLRDGVDFVLESVAE
jgi:hypothetical protein